MIDRTHADQTAWLHPESEVHADCIIGARTVVWQFASVIRRSVIGSDCRIATCSIVDGSSLGNGCIVSHGAFIDPGMAIGDDVFIGPGVKLCNDFWPRAHKVGWFNINDLIERKVFVTVVETAASLGAGVIVMPGLRIGARAMVAAGAVVTENVPADYLWRRDGSMVPIDERRVNRIRACS